MDFDLDNVGSEYEYHETERRFLTDKDVFYIVVICVLVAVYFVR